MSSRTNAFVLSSGAAAAAAVAAMVLVVTAAASFYRNNSSAKATSSTDPKKQRQVTQIQQQAKSIGDKKNNNKNKKKQQEESKDSPAEELLSSSSASSSSASSSSSSLFRILSRNSISIVHGSVTGTCQRMAQDCLQLCQATFPSRRIQCASIQEFDWWDEFINDDNNDNDDNNINDTTNAAPLILILLPTFTNGEWTVPSYSLRDALQELLTDWRIAQFPLKESKKRVQFAVYGVGSSAYDAETMGQPAREAVRWMQQLGAKCVARLAIGDSESGNHAWETYETWIRTVLAQLQKPKIQQKSQTQHPQSRSAGARKGTKPSSRISDATTVVVVVDEEKDASSSSQSKQQQQQQPNKTSHSCGGPKNSSDDDKKRTGACCQTDENNNNNDMKELDRPCCSTTTINNGNDVHNCDANENPEHKNDDGSNDDNDDHYDDYDDDEDEDDGEPEVMDLEDMGDAIEAAGRSNKTEEPREMVTPSQAAALKKEGYKLIGTHSAVKLCRWTKHQLRGRGGCYKHSFYGITSYQCMEATPSLACANKCVFCWRHHKNPVGKEWRWKTDDPIYIVEQAVQTHVQMIKETKGIPGVRMDRWKEAHTVKHCALSLVGEPVMYPRIGELLCELHRRSISTFLVTNGQHPSAIDSLPPVTQLYVSVDAPTQSSLIEIDRPLFHDAWDRLRQSLGGLKSKGQRTVARLTVVKGWNSNEISGYAELIALGQVGLVEVKGVTYCGKSDASNLNMSNSPWHHEVVALTVQLRDELKALRQKQLQQQNMEEEDIVPEYDLACEHKHSCSVLLARVDQFSDVIDPVTGTKRWNTWIDYDKFQQLVARHALDGTSFTVREYTAPTPSWALFGAKEDGFDPTETRHRKATKHPKYTRFDDRGIPTHDDNDQPLSVQEKERLTQTMEQRIQELKSNCGETQSVVVVVGGEKRIEDPALFFRGMVVTK